MHAGKHASTKESPWITLGSLGPILIGRALPPVPPVSGETSRRVGAEGQDQRWADTGRLVFQKDDRWEFPSADVLCLHQCGFARFYRAVLLPARNSPVPTSFHT